MKLIAINGSPRKNYSTAKLVESASRGAADAGAECEIVHLYDLSFKGCISCFACHRKGNPREFHCNYRDELTPVLEKIEESDALIIGSPIYLDETSSSVRALLERMCFPYVSYDDHSPGVTMYDGAPKNTAMIFVMNAPKWEGDKKHAGAYNSCIKNLGRFKKEPRCMYVNETYQFDDYSKYDCLMFDVAERMRIRDEEFPIRLQEAYELGKTLVTDI